MMRRRGALALGLGVEAGGAGPAPSAGKSFSYTGGAGATAVFFIGSLLQEEGAGARALVESDGAAFGVGVSSSLNSLAAVPSALACSLEPLKEVKPAFRVSVSLCNRGSHWLRT